MVPFLFFILFAVPLAFCAIRPAFLAPCRAIKGYALARILAFGLSAAAFLFLAARHHQDAFSGVDTGAYGLLADDLASGSPAVAGDPLASSLPQALLEAFLYRPLQVPGKVSLRPTRNCAYQLTQQGGGWSRRPFYTAGYPLAAAGSHLGRLFAPFAGALFCLALMLAAAYRHGLAGVACAAAALCATPYPAWFLRGDYPEAIAATTIMTVAVSCLARPFSGLAAWVCAGFLTMFPMSFHATALLLAGPVAMLLLFSATRGRDCAALLSGFAAGLAPSVWLTRCVSAPYGDWTRPLSLLRVARAAPEHAAMFAAQAAIAALAIAALVVSRSRGLRAALSRLLVATPTPVAAAIAILPLAGLPALPEGAATEVRFAIPLALASLRAPALVAALLALVSLSGRGNAREKALLVLLSWSGFVFLLVFGHETLPFRGPPAGVWNFRRLAPPVLAFAALAALSLPRLVDMAKARRARLAIAALLAVVAIVNPIRSTASYAAISGKGSQQAVKDTLDAIDRAGADLVVFDYFPHSVPFGVLRGNVLGLAPHAYGKWGDVAGWIGALAASGTKICMVSSYPDVSRLETGFRLEFRERVQFDHAVVKSRRFLDASTSHVPISLGIYDVAPPGGNAQKITFGGGPEGLRGGWSRASRGGCWSRQDSGFAAPLPGPGAPVEATFDIEWIPPDGGPSNRIMRIDFEGNRFLAMLRVSPGRHAVTTRFVSERELPPAGIYTVTTPAPYDPASHGLKGYPADLGVVFHSIDVRRLTAQEPAAEAKDKASPHEPRDGVLR